MRLPQKDWFSFFFQTIFWKTLPFIGLNSVQHSRYLHLWDADDHSYYWASLTKRLSYPGCVASKGTLDKVMLIDGILFVTWSLQDQQNDCDTQFLSIFFQILYFLNKIFGLILDANIDQCTEPVGRKITHLHHTSFYCNHYPLIHFPLRLILTKW